jgi:hypothetical protein
MELALRERAGLLEGLRPCFARTQVWLQAGKYVAALAGGLHQHPARHRAQQVAVHLSDLKASRNRCLMPPVLNLANGSHPLTVVIQ